MIGQILFYNKLIEVSPEYVVNTVMNSKKKFSPEAIARTTKILYQMGLNTAKKKGVKAGVNKEINAVVHASRHPKAVKALKAVQFGGPEGATYPYPWHVWMR